jgi:hypothetical protein
MSPRLRSPSLRFGRGDFLLRHRILLGATTPFRIAPILQPRQNLALGVVWA